MGRRQKNQFVKDCNLSEAAIKDIVFCWLLGLRAGLASEALSKEARVRKEKGISRETITRFYNEIGEHLWLLVMCGPLFAAKIQIEHLSPSEAVLSIKANLAAFHPVVQRRYSSEAMTGVLNLIRGSYWESYLGPRVFDALQGVYHVVRGFSPDKMHCHLTRVLFIEEYLAIGVPLAKIPTVALEGTLDLLRSYPLRAELPRDRFPWAEHWKATKP